MGFLSFILIVIIGFWVLGLLFRHLAPFLLRRYVNKMQNKSRNNFEDMFKQNASQANHTFEKKDKNSKKKDDDDFGEYVDFEEVK